MGIELRVSSRAGVEVLLSELWYLHNASAPLAAKSGIPKSEAAQRQPLAMKTRGMAVEKKVMTTSKNW